MDFSAVSVTTLPPRPPTDRVEPEEARRERLHITATGREGRALRKQLAIALGLRPKTSSSASTTSQSEGEENHHLRGLLEEMMRRQRRTKVATGKMQLPDLGKLALNTGSTTTSRKVTRKTRITHTSLVDSDDNLDSKSKEHRTQEKYRLARSDVSENTNTVPKEIRNSTKTDIVNGKGQVDEVSEGIFSYYGEPTEGPAVVLSAGSAGKLLRGKRTAKTREKTDADRNRQQHSSFDASSENKTDFDQSKLSFERRHDSNNLRENIDITASDNGYLIRPSHVIGLESTPLMMDSFEGWEMNGQESKELKGLSENNVIESASDKSQAEKTKKSQIPRLVKDTKTGARLRHILSSVAAPGNTENSSMIANNQYDGNLTSLTTQTQSNFDVNFRKLFINSKGSSLSSKSTETANHDSSGIDFDYDALELELAKLKHSVYKTLEDFQEMKEETFRLTREVRDMRDAQ